jgi:hypothetical protein
MKLYKENGAGPTAEEYKLILEYAQGKKSVLEFGPGSSTYAFIEANVPVIVSCESNSRWYQVARTKFDKKVYLIKYDHTLMPLSIPKIDKDQFELVLVDAPIGIQANQAYRVPEYEECSRINTLLYALEKAPIVLLHDAHRVGEQKSLEVVRSLGYNIKIHDTEKGLAVITKC